MSGLHNIVRQKYFQDVRKKNKQKVKRKSHACPGGFETDIGVHNISTDCQTLITSDANGLYCFRLFAKVTNGEKLLTDEKKNKKCKYFHRFSFFFVSSTRHDIVGEQSRRRAEFRRPLIRPPCIVITDIDRIDATAKVNICLAPHNKYSLASTNN